MTNTAVLDIMIEHTCKMLNLALQRSLDEMVLTTKLISTILLATFSVEVLGLYLHTFVSMVATDLLAVQWLIAMVMLLRSNRMAIPEPGHLPSDLWPMIISPETTKETLQKVILENAESLLRDHIARIAVDQRRKRQAWRLVMISIPVTAAAILPLWYYGL